MIEIERTILQRNLASKGQAESLVLLCLVFIQEQSDTTSDASITTIAS